MRLDFLRRVVAAVVIGLLVYLAVSVPLSAVVWAALVAAGRADRGLDIAAPMPADNALVSEGS
jgi:hypothetical protein